MKTSKFINEIGNKIIIKIKNKKDIGINNKTKKKIKFNGVSISLIGPTSESEWIITQDEAEELYYLLDEYLFDK